MKLVRKRGDTSNILQIFIQDSSSSTGAGLTGLTNLSGSLTAYYHRDVDTTATAISLQTMTVGTFTSAGFKEIDSANMPGWYQFCPPDAALAASGTPHSVALHLKGATNMAPLPIEVQLIAADVEDATRLGLTALPNANAAATNGLLTSGAGSNQITTSSGQVTVATNNDKTGYTASTVSDKTGYSLAASQTFNVTGNITGNVTGSVGSVTAGVIVTTNNDKTGYALTQSFPTNFASLAITAGGAVTAGTISDKTGYALTSAYDPAKTAAQVGSAMTLDLTQAIPTSNTAQTMGDALNAARAQGFGKWVVSGTTLTLYAANGSTVVRTFTLDSATAPTSRT